MSTASYLGYRFKSDIVYPNFKKCWTVPLSTSLNAIKKSETGSATHIFSYELCTSQHHLPPRSKFDILTNHLPPPPCCLVTSCAASGSSNSWKSSGSNLSVTSSVSTFISVCHLCRSLSPPLHLLRHRPCCSPFILLSMPMVVFLMYI